MSTDIYQVEVLDRIEGVLRLHLAHEQGSPVPVGRSFAAMLLAEGGVAALEAWEAKVIYTVEDFDKNAAIRRVAVTGSGEGWTELTIEVDLPEMLQPIAPGQTWGSTAYDELGDAQWFDGGEAIGWEREAGQEVVLPELKELPPDLEWIIEEHAPPVVVVSATTTACELPGLDPRRWVQHLRPVFLPLFELQQKMKGLAAARDRFGTVTLVALEGSRDTQLRATYRIEAVDSQLVGYARDGFGGWKNGRRRSRPHPQAVRTAAPEPSAAGEVEAFEELWELAEIEGLEDEVLGEALTSTRDVVHVALGRCAKRSDEDLLGLVEIWTSCLDEELRRAALEALAAMAPESRVLALERTRAG